MSYLNLLSGFKQILARARVDCGDAMTLGSRPIAAGMNVASAVGTAAGSNGTLTVTFAVALPDANYGIDLTAYSNNAANIANDNTLSWMIQSKSATGFALSSREWSPVVQGVTVDFQCWKIT
jgi:predicted phage gp36 major capsid-like protein